MNIISQKDNFEQDTSLKGKSKNNFNGWLLKIVTVVALVYLVLVPFGRIKKVEPTDVAIFTIILLFNSGLVERLAKLQYKDGEVTVELNEIKEEQERQKENLDAHKKLIERLAELEQKAAANPQQKEIINKFLLNEDELKHLKRLASNEPVLDYVKRQSFKQELRRLRTLGFIESLPEKHIGSMKDGGNLRNYVRITERGREYLEQI
ncbi:hypothetical protein NDI44_00305 [Trichocoleus sp. DQ-A3]|uniref:hypothetical protein n=1 Tax=Cyanophyceae TaxID=3028117 RepID=UPI0016860C67|nr:MULTISPECIES: hypothetical protein [unclassified Coleofasciculus]MBD1898411.1 hypothetical protein [Coleofasciculus sp. FACHB-125]MBD2085129.1 hypothetical protein [Coleofasciculus sp. FACHB-542]